MRNPDFVKFAESMGCVGIRVKTMEELSAKMKEFLECKEPVIIDCVVEKDEHVYPMVPAGKALHEMELGETKLTEVFALCAFLITNRDIINSLTHSWHLDEIKLVFKWR